MSNPTLRNPPSPAIGNRLPADAGTNLSAVGNPIIPGATSQGSGIVPSHTFSGEVTRRNALLEQIKQRKGIASQPAVNSQVVAPSPSLLIGGS